MPPSSLFFLFLLLLLLLFLQASYLAKAGKAVGVFEKRHVLGGAAVTEEIVAGEVRRALRQKVIQETMN